MIFEIVKFILIIAGIGFVLGIIAWIIEEFF
jgi:hypothetical protein